MEYLNCVEVKEVGTDIATDWSRCDLKEYIHITPQGQPTVMVNVLEAKHKDACEMIVYRPSERCRRTLAPFRIPLIDLTDDVWAFILGV